MKIRGHSRINSISSIFGIRLKILNKLLRKIDVFPQCKETQAKHQNEKFSSLCFKFEHKTMNEATFKS